MVIVDCEQGTREWIEHRLGIPTASEFKRIVTNSGKLSTSRDTYIGELLAEWALGEPMHDFSTEWTERGKFLEPEAFNYYAFQTDMDPQSVGLCLTDDRRVGASPDGLVGELGLLELKCPMAPTHLLYLARGTLPKEYRAQVQGQLWVTGRDWCDFMSYFPKLPPFITRVYPDPMYHDALSSALPSFNLELEAGREELIRLGVGGANGDENNDKDAE